ncbi:MAG: hypothetical protein JW712_01850 [Dehalococcoidales bacterium]|nr:hypothetical protein [Dehalococcoidales bacterium]
MSENFITDDLLNQYKCALGMFRDAINLFPADEWKRGDFDYLRPAGVACHVVEAMDFYTGSTPPDTFPWGGRFGIDWESPDSEKLPDQLQVLEYLDEIEMRLETWFGENDMLSEETLMPWTGKTLIGRVAYGIRHVQHHLAEMSLELTRRGYSSPEWR